MNTAQKIITRQSLALFSSILILLNSLLVACGPNQSLPQLMKSSLAGDVSDDGSGSDDGGDSDEGGDDDSGGDEEGPGTVSEPEPIEPSNGGDSGSTGPTVDRPGPSDGKVTLEDKDGKKVTKVEFEFSGKSQDNKGRDTQTDKDAERSVGSDKSVSISEDAGEPTGSRSDTMPEGSPALGNGEGLGSGSGGKANDGGSGGPGPGGSPKNKETKKFPDLPAFVGDTDGIDGSMDKTIRDANALFDGSGPDLNKQIGNSITNHNNSTAILLGGLLLIGIPAAATIPAWIVGAGLAALLAGALAGSLMDFSTIEKLWNNIPEPTPPELEATKKELENILPSMGYHHPPRLETLPGFPDTKPAKKKTSVQGGGGRRARWKDSKGKIYEWDSQHGDVEVYDPTGKNHQGSFDHQTGKQNKPPDPKKKVEP